MSDAQSTEQVVSALFAERQRFEAWIATLEAKRESTPAHIYNRVHADYTARLQRVVEQLGEHRAALEDRESALMDRITALDLEEAKHRDEAAEAELRAAVGELPADAHRDLVRRTAEVIEASAAERQQITEELLRLRTILDAGTAPVAKVEAPAAEGLRFIDDLGPAKPAPDRTKGPLAPPRDSEPDNEFDELAFLKSLDEPGGEQHQTATDGTAAGTQPAPPAQRRTPIDSPVIASRAVPPPPPRASGTKGAEGSAAGGTQRESSATRDGRDAASPYLKESPPEQVKTLKCQECGTLNYPTEWYCERCGAELAAL
jgi:hypothetical protein